MGRPKKSPVWREYSVVLKTADGEKKRVTAPLIRLNKEGNNSSLVCCLTHKSDASKACGWSIASTTAWNAAAHISSHRKSDKHAGNKALLDAYDAAVEAAQKEEEGTLDAHIIRNRCQATLSYQEQGNRAFGCFLCAHPAIAYRIADSEFFRTFLNTIAPEWHCPHSTAASGHAAAFSDEVRQRLKEKLHCALSAGLKISIGKDHWRSKLKRGCGCLGIMAFFYDMEGNRTASATIGLLECDSTSGKEMMRALSRCLLSYGVKLEDVFRWCTDGASANAKGLRDDLHPSMHAVLKEQNESCDDPLCPHCLSEILDHGYDELERVLEEECDEYETSVKCTQFVCILHAFQLVLKDALSLDAVKKLLGKCNSLAILCRTAPVKAALKKAGWDKTIPLHLEVRWNSQIDCLRSIDELCSSGKLVYETITDSKGGVEMLLTPAELLAVKDISSALRLYREFSITAQASSSPTMDCVLKWITLLEKHGNILLKEPGKIKTDVGHSVIQQLLASITTRFDKYRNPNAVTRDRKRTKTFDPVPATASYLSPTQYQLVLRQGQSLLDAVQQFLRGFMKEFVKTEVGNETEVENETEPPSLIVPEITSESSSADLIAALMAETPSTSPAAAANSPQSNSSQPGQMSAPDLIRQELRNYQELLEKGEVAKLVDRDASKWWSQSGMRASYPILSRVALTILSCPAGTAAVERLFLNTRSPERGALGAESVLCKHPEKKSNSQKRLKHA